VRPQVAGFVPGGSTAGNLGFECPIRHAAALFDDVGAVLDVR
jgi:hypothetical protein